jgi:hypothetical protein
MAGGDLDWPVYLGDAGSRQYSALNQITRENVDRLEVAWIYRSGDARADNLSQIQCNPLIIDGVLYGTTPGLRLVALDAATGPSAGGSIPFEGTLGDRPGVNRGVVYWVDGDDRRVCSPPIIICMRSTPRSGKPSETFGVSGRVDLKEGLGRDVLSYRCFRTPRARFIATLLFMPMRLGEGPAPPPRVMCGPTTFDRADRLDLSHDSASRRVRLRDLAAGRVVVHRRGQLLGRDVRGRASAGLCLCRPVRRRSISGVATGLARISSRTV